jgi:hypothetical protein
MDSVELNGKLAPSVKWWNPAVNGLSALLMATQN